MQQLECQLPVHVLYIDKNNSDVCHTFRNFYYNKNIVPQTIRLWILGVSTSFPHAADKREREAVEKRVFLNTPLTM